MVNIIESWDVLEEYAGGKLGFYQVLINDNRIEVRVHTGRIGFIQEFPDRNDKLYEKILGFCKRHRYIEITEHLRDEEFFK